MTHLADTYKEIEILRKEVEFVDTKFLIIFIFIFSDNYYLFLFTNLMIFVSGVVFSIFIVF